MTSARRTPNVLAYREVIRRLLDHDKRFFVKTRRGKGSHRMIFHPDISGRQASYPVKHHGDQTEIRARTLEQIITTFELPEDVFDSDPKRD